MKRFWNKPPHLIRTAASLLSAVRIRCGGKKIITRTLCILLIAVVAVWALAPDLVQAQVKQSAFSGAATGLAKVGGGLLMIGYIFVALTVLLSVLSGGLALVGGLLNYAYSINIAVNPGNLAVVQEGWRVLRDLANGLLILVIIWIAITIILNLEEYGGKKLLVRVIAVGLLINFSLVFVTIPFSLGNELAKPFMKALGTFPICKTEGGQQKCDPAPNTLSDLIINNSQIQQVTQIVTDEGAVETFQKGLEELKKTQTVAPSNPIISAGQYFGVPQSAQAFAVLGVPLAVILAKFAYATAAAVAGAIATGLLYSAAHALGVDAALFKGILNLVFANALLLFTIISLATAAVILILRVVAMIFLGVFAPLAFIGIAFPRFGDRIWNPWLDNLFRWAFVAPIFYFLLYLALLMLQLNRSGYESLFAQLSITSNFFKMLNLVLFLIFLWAAVFFTRKTAGQAAEIALSGLRRGLGYAGGYGLGVLQRRALPGLGQAAEATGVRIGEIKSPFLRGLLKQPTRALRGVAWAGREQVRRDATRLGSMTSPELQRAIGSGEFSESERAAAMMVLQQRRDLTPMKDSRGDAIRGYDEAAQRRGVDTIRRAGLDIAAFLRANPLLARPTDYRPGQLEDEQKEMLKVMNSQRAERGEQALSLDQVQFNNVETAQRLAAKSIRPEHIPQMDMGVFDNAAEIALSDGRRITQGNHMKELALDLWRGEHYNRLGRESPKVAGDVQDYLEKEPEGKRIWDRMDDKKQAYFSTNTAQELSWKRPAYADGAGTAGGQGAPVFGARTLRDGQVGTPYTADLQPSGGTPPFTFSTINGTDLPPGLAFDPPGATADAARRITGNPTSAGRYRVAIQMTDSAGVTGERTFTIIIT